MSATVAESLGTASVSHSSQFAQQTCCCMLHGRKPHTGEVQSAESRAALDQSVKNHSSDHYFKKLMGNNHVANVNDFTETDTLMQTQTHTHATGNTRGSEPIAVAVFRPPLMSHKSLTIAPQRLPSQLPSQLPCQLPRLLQKLLQKLRLLWARTVR